MTYLRTGYLLTTALSLTFPPLTAAVAQDGPGLQGSFSISQGLEFSDNPNLSSNPGDSVLQSRTGLGFALTSETRVESFRFDLGTQLLGDIVSGDDGEDFEFNNYRANLRYSRQGANSRLAFSASYRNVQLEDIELDVDFDPDVLVIDNGARQSLGLSATYALGIEGPFGFEVTARSRTTEYVDTLDPELEDSESRSIDAVARFRINPAVTARALAGVTRISEDDVFNTEREISYVGVGVQGENASGLTYVGDLTFDRSEINSGATTLSEDDGLGVFLSLTQDRPAGVLGFELSSRIDDTGRRSQASASRSFDLPDGGVSFSVGVVDQEDADLQLTAGVNYTRELPRGGLTASLTQTPVTNDGDAFLNTGLSVAYQQSIDATSSWDAELSYFATNELGGDDDDTRTTATVAYRRELTRDWDLRTGYEHERLDQSGGGDARSNTVFLNIERDFTFGF